MYEIAHRDPFWTYDPTTNIFEHDGSKANERAYPHDRDTILTSRVINNARLEFEITAHPEPSDHKAFHTALIFRAAPLMRQFKFYGLGLGGWNNKASLFAFNGYQAWPVPLFDGSTIDVVPQKPYVFSIDIIGRNVDDIRIDGQAIQAPQTRMPWGFNSGRVGFYAYSVSSAKCKILKITDLPIKIFMLIPIREGYQEMENRLRRLIQTVSERSEHSIEIVSQCARDLPKDMPLMKKIAQAVNNADIVISDFGMEGVEEVYNVAYETGIAHVLNIPTIHIYKEFNGVPSDLHNQFFINRNDLEKDLPPTIKAILETHSFEGRYL